jgi:hypothetical protein
MTEFRKKLSGVPLSYAAIVPGSKPHQVWDNIRTALQRTITKSSDYAMKQLKSLTIQQFKNVNAFLDEYTLRLSNLIGTQKKLGQVEISEIDKINTLFAGLEGSPYYNHRTSWVQKSDEEAKNDTVEKYIHGLRKDAAIGSATTSDNAYISTSIHNNDVPTSSTSESIVTTKLKKEKERLLKKLRELEGKNKNINNDNNKSNVNFTNNDVIKKNLIRENQTKSFPYRKKDEKGIEREKNKPLFKKKSSFNSSIKCNYCDRIGHSYENCRKRLAESEKGKSLIECSSDNDDIHYSYDNEEREICLGIRDSSNDGNDLSEIATEVTTSNDPRKLCEKDPVANETCLMARTRFSSYKRKINCQLVYVDADTFRNYPIKELLVPDDIDQEVSSNNDPTISSAVISEQSNDLSVQGKFI